MAISRLIDCPHKPNPIAATTNRSAGLHLSCGGVCPKGGGLKPTFIYTRSPAAISSYSTGLGVGLASQSFPGKINLLMVPTSLSHSKKKKGGEEEVGNVVVLSGTAILYFPRRGIGYDYTVKTLSMQYRGWKLRENHSPPVPVLRVCLRTPSGLVIVWIPVSCPTGKVLYCTLAVFRVLDLSDCYSR